MKYRLSVLFMIFILPQVSCATVFTQVKKAERKALKKSSYVIKSPSEYSLRTLANNKNYDPKPRVVVVDKNAGKYEFRWIGYDGKEKIVSYQRHDALDATVETVVEKKTDGHYLYTYRFKILPASPAFFSEFVLQTLASDVTPVKPDAQRFYVSTIQNAMSNNKEGIWWSFAFIGEDNQRIFGENIIEFQMTSKSPPGIVACNASGAELGTMGVGEHLPTELENEIPIFEDILSGYAVGPSEKLSTLSTVEKIKYIQDNLQKFEDAGWITSEARSIYDSFLKKGDLGGLLNRLESDLQQEFITGEIYYIFKGLQSPSNS